MAGERLRRILAALSPDDGARSSARVCAVAADITAMTGAGVMLMSGEVPRGSLCTTNRVSELIEELQYAFGEGPCVDAYEQDRVVHEPDLADPTTPRWFGFSPRAVEAGARAVFGFPMRVGGVRLGALNLYRDRPGPLDDDQHADALIIAEVAAQWVLDSQAKAPPGAIAEELMLGADFRFAEQNAAGIVAAQLGISVTDALIRLRAHAFTSDRPLGDVAADVIAHRLRLDPTAGGQ